jgi:hypothetical protein
MGVSGQLYVLPALPRKMEAVLITGEKVWWTPDVVWRFWRTEKSLAFDGY